MMKKLIGMMIVLLSMTIVACDEGAEAPSFDWLDAQPSADKVVLTARISAGDGATISEVGFAYRETDGQFVEVRCENFDKGLARQTITGLKSETEYLWFCYAVVGGDRFESNPIQKFTTLKGNENPEPGKPNFQTPTADAVGSGSAVLSCAYTYQGDQSVESAGFGYRKSTDEEYTRQEIASTSSPLTFVLENLEPATKYEFYAYLVIGGESYESAHATLTTTSTGEVAKPEFGSLSATNVTETAATISGSFTYEGEESITEAGFEYKKNGESQYASRTVTATPGSKSVSLTGLTASTTYTYRMYVVVGQTRYQSSESTFTTSAAAAVGVYRTGWAELPVEVSNSDYYYAHHLCPDFYVGGQKARNYTVCFSAENHCPLWVAAPRHACYEEKNADRTDAYKRDPDIPSNIQYSSKDTGGGCNKGHMLGSNERRVTRKTNEQVFYYSNIAPQYSSNFNTGGGAWNNLEEFVDGQVCRDTTYIVIGTYFEPYTDAYGKSCSPSRIEFGGRSDVNRPSMFYYAILRTKSGSTGKSVKDCSASELKCAAFVLRHNMDKGHEPQAKDMISVEELEALTGFTYFANVPQAPKGKPNPSDWGL